MVPGVKYTWWYISGLQHASRNKPFHSSDIKIYALQEEGGPGYTPVSTHINICAQGK